MKVSDIAQRDVARVAPEAGTAHAAALMRQLCVRHLPVVCDGKVIGMVSDRDVFACGAATRPSQRRPEARALPTVETVMSRPAVCVAADLPVAAAARIMADRKVGALAVVSGDLLIGLVTDTDVLGCFLDQVDAPAEVRGCFDLPAVEIMSIALETVEPSASMETAHQRMKDRDIRHLAVTSGGRLVGMLSDRDVCRAAGCRSVAADDGDGGSARVRDYMSDTVRALERSATVADAARMMVEHRISAVPVLERGRPAGIVTTTDVLDHLSRSSS
jgi:CBS domain-containing protein